MKGLALSESYFKSFGLPLIKNQFAPYADRIAAGLVGEGSECLHFDDEISRDHDWGPDFCLWLTEADFNSIGEVLQLEIEKLPKTFSGFEARVESEWGGGRIGVFEIGRFYSKFIGVNYIPRDIDTWRFIPEQHLATCTNGKVFYDPLGEFSRWRAKLLAFYPEDVRLKKIASRCMTIAQAGQYNLARSSKRGEYFAARYAEIKFCADVISLVFLLNKRYVPFYKWMHRALKGLPIIGERIHLYINSLIGTTDCEEKISIAQKICDTIIEELRKEGLTDSSSPFLLDHGPLIQKKIKNNALRKSNVWLD